MTVFIDPPNAPGHGRMWSHLVSDTSFAELHEFARRIGVPPRGFDRDHYDIPAERYDDVVAAGAAPVTSRELIALLRRSGLRRRKTTSLGRRRPGHPLVRPPRLRAGDVVAVVAPSGPVPPERLDAGLAVLRSWGLDVREGPASRGRSTTPYLAASDAERAAELAAAWCDSAVAAVFCARGGYGAQRIVDLLPWPDLMEAGPRILVGSSDVTSLHQAFARRLGVVTVHGPVVTQLAEATPAARDWLRSLLLEPERALEVPCGGRVLAPGRAEGVLVGGNLAVLAAEAGTPTVRVADGGIAVLEDVGEEPYRLDRLLTQLLRSGWFGGVRAVVVGQLSGCGPADEVAAVITDRVGGLGVPVVVDAMVGHVAGNVAVPLGARAVLDADAATLTLVEPALS